MFARIFAVLTTMAVVPAAATAQVSATWDNTTGNWTDFTRWSTNPLFPNNGNGGNNYNAVVTGGAVTVNQDITIQGLTFGGGTITRGAGFTLTTNAPFNWTGGTLNGAGTLQVNGAGSITGTRVVNGGVMQFGGGTFTHNGGAQLQLNSGAVARVQTGAVYVGNATVGNTILTATSGTGSLIVDAGGTFRKTGTNDFFVNSGVTVNNSGLADVQQGFLRVESGATWTNTGAINVASGATFLAAGTVNLNTGSSVSGAGTFHLISGGVNANVNSSIERLLVSGSGNFQRAAGTTTTVVADFSWGGGSFGGAGAVQVNGGGTIFGIGSKSATLGSIRFGDGTTASTINHQDSAILTFTATQMSVRANTTYVVNSTTSGTGFRSSSSGSGTFTVDAGGIFRKTGAGTHTLSTQSSGLTSLNLTNAGTVDVQQGTVAVNVGQFTQLSGAQLILSNGALLQVQTTGQYVVNASTANTSVSAGTGTGSLVLATGGGLVKTGTFSLNINSGITLNNSGAYIDVQGGTLAINSGATFATNTGAVYVASGANFQGNVTNSSTGFLGGAGTVTGNVNLNAAGATIGAGNGTADPNLTITNGLAMANNSKYQVTLFGTGVNDISRVNVTGGSTVINTGADLELNLSALDAAQVQALRNAVGVGNSRDYTVLAATGIISGGGFTAGNFSITNLGSFTSSEWALVNGGGGGSNVVLRFTPVSEPAGLLAVAAVGVVGLAAARRLRRSGRPLLA